MSGVRGGPKYVFQIILTLALAEVYSFLHQVAAQKSYLQIKIRMFPILHFISMPLFVVQ